MQRKLFAYMLILALILIITLVIGLFLFGQFSGTQEKMSETLKLQEEVFEKDITAYYNELAMRAIQLSENAALKTEVYLSEHGMGFEDLKDSREHIQNLEGSYMELLKTALLKAECSAAFIMLDTTVNSTLPGDSKAGVYIQRSSIDPLDDSLLLYRGDAGTGKSMGIMPHRKWHLEFNPDQFPDYKKMMSKKKSTPSEAVEITDIITLPGSSERVMLITLPIFDSDGTALGICGFEISESLFKATHSQPTTLSHLLCMFSKKHGNAISPENSFSCGVSGGYYLPPEKSLYAKDFGSGLVSLKSASGSEEYIGITKDAVLFGGNYTLSVMITKADYTAGAAKNAMQMIILALLLIFAVLSCCTFFSKRFISPVIKGLEEIRHGERREPSNYTEIDDLFDFLSQKDSEYEKTLDELTKEKERIQSEIEKLSYSRKKEIHPDDYEYFLTGIKTLTKAEKNIFNMYLNGKTSKEIAEELGIKERTIKYHNHNIYEKLGVSSRKQLLRFAAVYLRNNEKSN